MQSLMQGNRSKINALDGICIKASKKAKEKIFSFQQQKKQICANQIEDLQKKNYGKVQL